MPEAARVTDQVKHSCALMGLMVGLTVGVAIAVAIGATGGAAAIAIGAAVCTGASVGGAIGKMIGKHILALDCGPIAIGVPSVIVGGMVASVVGGNISCTGPPMAGPHPTSVIAQGSSSVLIGGMPAARKGDKTVCGATIAYGCNSVIIGGEQVTYMQIQPEVPAGVDWGLTALGLVGSFGLLRAAGFSLAGTLARLGGATAGGFTGSWAGVKLAEELGFNPDSWGHDLMGFGGGLIGGGAGYKAGGGVYNKYSSRGRLGFNTIGEPRTATPDEVAKINEIRKKYDISKKKNVAYSEGKLDGDAHYRASHSGTESKPGTAEAKPFKDQQIKTGPTKRDIDKGQTEADRRAYESESKILEEILDQTNQNSKGKVKIVSERPFCDSCSSAIEQFKIKRPGIEIDKVEMPKTSEHGNKK